MKPAILLVDDSRDARELLAALLTGMGYETDVAQDGASALTCLEHKPYGIVILDFQMPGMNGVELFRRMRQIRPDLAGVFLTGYTTIDVVYPAIEAGVLRVLAKPVDFAELLPILQEHTIEQTGAGA